VHFDPCRCIALSFDRQPIWIQQSKTGSRSREAKNRVAPSLGIDPICLSHFSMPGYETSQDRSKIDLICRSAGQSCLPFSVQILPILAPFLPQQCSPQFLFDQLPQLIIHPGRPPTKKIQKKTVSTHHEI
jgi:hypothetical protein